MAWWRRDASHRVRLVHGRLAPHQGHGDLEERVKVKIVATHFGIVDPFNAQNDHQTKSAFFRIIYLFHKFRRVHNFFLYTLLSDNNCAN